MRVSEGQTQGIFSQRSSQQNLCVAAASIMDAWSDIADEYATRVEPFTDSFVAALLDEIAPTTLEGVRLLDLACGAGAGRAAMASADARDVRDAKLLRTCAALCGAEATVHAHGAAPEQLLVGGARAFHLDQFLDDASGEMAAVVAAVAKADATVFSEAHSDATLPHALHGLDGTVAKHAYPPPVWLAGAPGHPPISAGRPARGRGGG